VESSAGSMRWSIFALVGVEHGFQIVDTGVTHHAVVGGVSADGTGAVLVLDGLRHVVLQ